MYFEILLQHHSRRERSFAFLLCWVPGFFFFFILLFWWGTFSNKLLRKGSQDGKFKDLSYPKHMSYSIWTLRDNLARCGIWDWKLFFLWALKTVFHCFSASSVAVEKNNSILTLDPFHEIHGFFLKVYRVFAYFLKFYNHEAIVCLNDICAFWKLMGIFLKFLDGFLPGVFFILSC